MRGRNYNMDTQALEKQLQDALSSNDMRNYVVIDNTKLAQSGKEELIVKGRSCDTSIVDLVKMAYYVVQGYDNAQIAKEFDTLTQNIYDIRGSERFKQILNLLTGEILATARTFLAASGLKAVTNLIKLMNSTNEKTQLKATVEVLDRIGLKTPEQLEIIDKGNKFATMSEAELAKMIKLGMDEIQPKLAGVEDGDNKTAAISAG
jgi:hypothetical protein